MRRVLHAKDLTGSEIERALNEKGQFQSTVSMFYVNHHGRRFDHGTAINGVSGSNLEPLSWRLIVLDINSYSSSYH
jgi:aspartate oxidase